MFINTYIAGQKVDVGGGHTVLITFANLAEFNGGGVMGASNAGEYMQGKYSFMMFGLPAAAAAMILAVPKETGNRKQAMSIIGSAAITSFLTGITEPIEFTFLFLAP
jgi:PTS system glucose-specific IIC component